MKMPKVTLTMNTKLAIGVAVVALLGGLAYYYYTTPAATVAPPVSTSPFARPATGVPIDKSILTANASRQYSAQAASARTYESPGLPSPPTSNSGARVTQPSKPLGVRFQGTWGWYDA